MAMLQKLKGMVGDEEKDDTSNLFLEISGNPASQENTERIYQHYSKNGVLGAEELQIILKHEEERMAKSPSSRSKTIVEHMASFAGIKELTPEEEERQQKKFEDEFDKKAQNFLIWEKVTDEQVLGRMPPRIVEEVGQEPRIVDPPMIPVPEDLDEQYTWDLVVVVKIGTDKQITIVKKIAEEKGAKPKKVKEKMSEAEWSRRETARILGHLDDCGLKTYCYKSIQEDEIYILVGASEKRLRREGSRIRIDLPLDADKTIEFGKKCGFQLAVRCGDPRYPGVTKESIFDGLYGAYKDAEGPEDDDRIAIYKKFDDSKMRPQSPFRSVDRLKLTLSIIEAEKVLGGANLKLRTHASDKKHPVAAFFPLHEHVKLLDLDTKVKGYCSLFRPPSNEFKDYFGEQIGLYFAFLSSYSTALLFPAIVGLAFMIWILGAEVVAVEGIPAYALLMAFWATAFLEAWKRRTAEYRVTWGQSHFLEKETARPEFDGEWEMNPVTGEFEETFPFWNKIRRLLFSQTIVWTFIVIVIGLVVGVLFLRQVLVSAIHDSSIPLVIASLINAVQIQVMNMIYGIVSKNLNDYENHKTDSGYENALIAKSFLFKFINSYQSLFYISFGKRYDNAVKKCKGSIYQQAVVKLTNSTYDSARVLLTDPARLEPYVWNKTDCNDVPELVPHDGAVCAIYQDANALGANYGGDCLQELAIQLAIIFATQIIVNNLIEFGGVFMKNYMSRRRESIKPPEPKKNGDVEMVQVDVNVHIPAKSPPELEYEQEQYEGTFSDYDELIVQFGYVVLFVVAFPAAPFLAVLNNLIENRLDAYKVIKMTRRPHPKGCYDIGTWETILQCLAWIALMTNVALIMFSPSKYFPDTVRPGDSGFQLWQRLAAFLVVEHILFGGKALLAYFIPDVPEWVGQLEARNQFLSDVYLGAD